jgi:3-oxoacyl-[acyl-carrier-protein] synthase-3
MKSSIITGCGAYLPSKILTNQDLEKMVDTNDEWITSRTGITQRHIAADGELTSQMAAQAANMAIAKAGVRSEDIDLIIVATTTPDNTFPSTATNVQSLIGAGQGIAFDIQAVCAGFVYALSVADNFIKTGQVKTALVIGADKMSSIVDWTDRNTCVLFGDGAGAVILQATDEAGRGILSTHLYADGQYQDILNTNGGTSSSGTVGKVQMLGQEVFKHAVEKMGASIKTALKSNNMEVADISYLIPHQANSRILEMVAKKLRLPEEKVISTVALHANTSAASIPLALSDAHAKGSIKKDDIVVFTAIGGGLAWGSCLIRW